MMNDMNNYHVARCEALINDASVSRELRLLAESMVAMGSGIDDADSMVQQSLERIEIVAERLSSVEHRLDQLEKRLAGAAEEPLHGAQ
jgi:DNA repair ATPase RecN